MRNALGLDISKATIDAAVIIGDNCKTAKFDNNPLGYARLQDWLNQPDADDLYICMEATGNYYEDAADYLGRHYKVLVVNPLKISSYAKSRFRRTKNDKQDAILIAEYCQSLKPKDLHIRQPVKEAHYRLKRLLTLREQLNQQKTAEKNRLQAAKDKFVKNVHASNIEHANGQLKQVDEQIAKTMQLQEFESISNNLQTIPGIGKITAAVLTNHLIDNPFKTANHWVAYAGLNPQAKESGTSVKDKAGITNYGNRKLRAALFMAAMVAYRRNYFPEFTKRMKEKRKPTKVILVAIMRKLAVIAYYIKKKGESFQPERYQQKAA